MKRICVNCGSSPGARAGYKEAARELALYQFYACPFCVKTRRAIHRLNVPIELRDAQNDPLHRQALQEGGGSIKVPCLRIEGQDGATWMYESSDIIGYLNRRFDPESADHQEAVEQAT